LQFKTSLTLVSARAAIGLAVTASASASARIPRNAWCPIIGGFLLKLRLAAFAPVSTAPIAKLALSSELICCYLFL
jgi:hypothetical protein